MEKVATFSWKRWISRIEDAVRENKPLKINLPEDEWIRLTKKGLTALKKQLSDKAAKRLCLIKAADRNYLLVAQAERCGC